MKKIKMLFWCLCINCLLVLQLNAQGKGGSAIGETMRSSGRIYVVVAVLLVILAGIIIYLVRLDRKISRLEKE